MAMAAGLASCSAPRYAGRAESEQRMSPCESAYSTATEVMSTLHADGWQPLGARYAAALTAQDQWIDVAAECTDRFDEGTIRAAQSRHLFRSIAGRLGIETGGGETTLSDVSALSGTDVLDIAGTVLDGMALAEDRAGFSAEILTARGASGASLALSNGHKTTGERLISLAGTKPADDPRQKVYEVGALLANPTTATDPANGLRASTLAVIEANCAREELAAVSGETGQTGQTGTDEASGTSGTSGDSGTGSGSSGDSASSDTATRTDALRTLARLIGSRLDLAFEAGYPATDHALFDD